MKFPFVVDSLIADREADIGKQAGLQISTYVREMTI